MTGPVLVAVDPGCARSALVELVDGRPRRRWLAPNAQILAVLRHLWRPDPTATLVIEAMESYGKPVGREVFDTCVWAGRFCQVWGDDARVAWLPRRQVKLALCGVSVAKDKDVAQAVRDRYGPSTAVAVGTTKAPGPLHGLRRDLWAALALGLAYQQQQQEGAGGCRKPNTA